MAVGRGVEAKKEWTQLVRHQLVLPRALKIASSETLAAAPVESISTQEMHNMCSIICLWELMLLILLPMFLAVCCVFIDWLYSTTCYRDGNMAVIARGPDCYIKIQLGCHLIQAKLQGVLRCLPQDHDQEYHWWSPVISFVQGRFLRKAAILSLHSIGNSLLFYSQTSFW
jgi:hypothetical protein